MEKEGDKFVFFISRLAKKSVPVGEILRKKLAFLQSRMTVQEQDPWFQTRVAQLESFSRQLQEMRGSLKSMGELKGRLEKATTEFQRGLVRTS